MSENEIVARNEQPGELVHQLPVAAPAVDIYENDAEILLHADMPGVLKDDISVNIDNGKMLLSGIRRLQPGGSASWRELIDVSSIACSIIFCGDSGRRPWDVPVPFHPSARPASSNPRSI